uniref:Helicase ATP-binding domain-containing protein n=1 Tax=Chenopodium quinoa TaxID=63459 RepID=A0A803NAD5_CHEQI
KLEPGGRVRRTKASAGCPMLRKQKLQKDFVSDVSQQEALDIEDLLDLGSRLGTCPYYGSRRMVPAADLVVLPYQSLLSKSSRESLGINLKNNIIIIDEAHNLADSLIGMYDAKITLSQEIYPNLDDPDRAFMQAIFDEDETNDNVTSNAVERTKAYCHSLMLRSVDMEIRLHAWRSRSLEVLSSKEGGSTLSGFRALLDMLLSLTNKNVDGRIIVSKLRSKGLSEQDGFIKYVMLTGEKIFSEIVNQAHAVILAGGTLQPIEETRERLFPWLPSQSLHFFSCGHIIPPESILPVAVSNGPSGQSFDFSYASRNSPKMIEELGLMLCNLVSVVPEGIVVFFSSFDYEDKIYEAWRTSGILNRITKKKRLFREPRSSSDIEGVLKEYKDTIDMLSNKALNESKTSLNGAVLLAVVGGKISEGINFSDGMGRCIVMVGLPYPSPSDIELIERIKHMEGIGDTKATNSLQVSNNDTYIGGNVNAGFDILRRCKRRGKEYYENLCMKAVNQSIGRAIRHINDYAAILLIDSRYVSDPIKRSSSPPASKLPQWIQDRLISSTSNYGEVHRLLHQFFKINKNKVSSINQRSHHLDHIYPDFFNCNQSSVSGHTDRGNADSSVKQLTNTDAHDSTEVISSAQDTADETAKQVEGP